MKEAIAHASLMSVRVNSVSASTWRCQSVNGGMRLLSCIVATG
jgi:hypothetical protein